MSSLDPKVIDIEHLSYVSMNNLLALPRCPSIYFALDTMLSPLYIGQTSSLRSRIRGHPLRKVFIAKGARLSWIAMPYEHLAACEIILIDFYKPPYNKMRGGTRRPLTPAAAYIPITFRVLPDLLAQIRAQIADTGVPLNTELNKLLRIGMEVQKKTGYVRSQILLVPSEIDVLYPGR